MARSEIKKAPRTTSASKSEHRVHKTYSSGRVTRSQTAKRDQMYLSNQKNSPLLRLPGELRNRIYEYALGGHLVEPVCGLGRLETVKDCQLRYCPYESKKETDYKPWDELLALTYVCRQVNQEGRLLVFEINTFQVRKRIAFDAWLLYLKDDQKQAITSVSFGSRVPTDRLAYDGMIPTLLHQCTGLKHVITLYWLHPVFIMAIKEFVKMHGIATSPECMKGDSPELLLMFARVTKFITHESEYSTFEGLEDALAAAAEREYEEEMEEWNEEYEDDTE
ncbi:hypothetical protein N0V83_004141 [Neocucurbitaria cava]|uniref:DUF7730 domain-containing protein n=1 Tax=Neocucurbitaria cava TaxID=798079 RepID=A0A9W9CN13_9PLEO|nr:hypothetical protein N0V83_004141 [Neocucurbitaria cava]